MTIDVLDLALMAGGVFYGVFALWLLVGVEKSRRRHREVSAAVNESLPSVSIIVSARNEAPDIDACLEALAAQKYCASFQVIVRGCALSPLGIMKRISAAVITMPASLTPVSPNHSVKGRRNIQQAMTVRNTTAMRRSAAVIGPRS